MKHIAPSRILYPYFETGATMDILSIAAVGLDSLEHEEVKSCDFNQCFNRGKELIVTDQMVRQPRTDLGKIVPTRLAASDVGFLMWYQKYLEHWAGSVYRPVKIWKPKALIHKWLEGITNQNRTFSMFSNEGEFFKMLILSHETKIVLEHEFWGTVSSIFPGLKKWIHFQYTTRGELKTILDTIVPMHGGEMHKKELKKLQMEALNGIYEDDFKTRVMHLCIENNMLSAMMCDTNYTKAWEAGVINAMFILGKYIGQHKDDRIGEWTSLLNKAVYHKAVFAIEALCKLACDVFGNDVELPIPWDKIDIHDPESDIIMMTLVSVGVKCHDSPLRPMLCSTRCNINQCAELYHLPLFDTPKWTVPQLYSRYVHPGLWVLECPKSIVKLLAEEYAHNRPMFVLHNENWGRTELTYMMHDGVEVVIHNGQHHHEQSAVHLKGFVKKELVFNTRPNIVVAPHHTGHEHRHELISTHPTQPVWEIKVNADYNDITKVFWIMLHLWSQLRDDTNLLNRFVI